MIGTFFIIKSQKVRIPLPVHSIQQIDLILNIVKFLFKISHLLHTFIFLRLRQRLWLFDRGKRCIIMLILVQIRHLVEIAHLLLQRIVHSFYLIVHTARRFTLLLEFTPLPNEVYQRLAFVGCLVVVDFERVHLLFITRKNYRFIKLTI